MMYQTDKGTIFKEIARNTAMIQSLSQQALTQKVTKFLLENNKIKFVAGDKKQFIIYISITEERKGK